MKFDLKLNTCRSKRSDKKASSVTNWNKKRFFSYGKNPVGTFVGKMYLDLRY